MSDKFKTVEQRVSYGIGLQMGDQLSNDPFEGLEIEAVLSGLSDALNGAERQVEPALLDAAFKEISAQIQKQQEEGAAKFAGEGEKFLIENAGRAEVTVTPSGLQYEILTAGDGDKPTIGSTVRTHYHGTLIDGKVFDSSYERGEPAEFPVNGVIGGWTEALLMMGVGSKWRLYVPHELAYGERGAGGDIGPYQALVFDVELLAILS
ncbi:MAG: FKBP-type peptidyl-prolyl cis-trans isomerase [Pseudomonadales bacterium]|nr:FKBP-type peptidyl-prolyl cis-trans isomerase [Pseudomonadales bacterium]